MSAGTVALQGERAIGTHDIRKGAGFLIFSGSLPPEVYNSGLGDTGVPTSIEDDSSLNLYNTSIRPPPALSTKVVALNPEPVVSLLQFLKR